MTTTTDLNQNIPTASNPPTKKPGGSNNILRLLAIFKFGKAILLVAVGLGAFGLMRPIFADHAEHWVASFAMSYNAKYVQQLVNMAIDLPPHKLEAIGIAAFLFAALFTTEGVGLWLGKRWAEYFTVIATLSLVPVELYELMHRLSPARFAALGINIALVVYLVYRIRTR